MILKRGKMKESRRHKFRKNHKLFHNLKSQITVFVILGLIILGIFAFLYRFSHSVSTGEIDKMVNLVYENFLDKNALEDYIQTCLDNSAKESLILVGLQSGNVYDSQIDGTYMLWGDSGLYYLPSNLMTYNKIYDINTTYGIRKPIFFTPCAYHCGPPAYPYDGSLEETHILTERYNLPLSNPFGLTFSHDNRIEPHVILTALCDLYGSNWYETPGAKRSCEIYNFRREPLSIQTFLKKYVQEKTPDCINFTYFTEKNYNIRFGDMITDVLIGENDVVFAINYSVNVSLKGSTSVTKYSIFSSKQNVKLKKIYELAHHMIIEDVRNIFFDMANPDHLSSYLNMSCSGFSEQGEWVAENTSCFDNSIFKISVFKDVCPACAYGNYSDIIRIEDNSSTINGQPYIFQFGVENRIPALDWIDESADPDSNYGNYLNYSFGKTPLQAYGPASSGSNLKVQQGSGAAIYPRAIDPDGDSITYLLDQDQSFCCNSFFTDNTFVIDTSGLSEGLHSFRLYACDEEGLASCQVSGFSCPTTNCANTNPAKCSLCDYQIISMDVTS